MLAFDIETTGLRSQDVVTCVCAYDPERNVHATFQFAKHRNDAPKCEAMREEFMRLMDEADRLCAFNGARFDIPFMDREWKIGSERVGSWIRKMFDPFEFCKLSLNITFSLARLLHQNGLEGKTGSGLDAVYMARDGRFDELASYCMQDTKVTHRVCSLEKIQLPPPHAGISICIGEEIPVLRMNQ